MSVHVSALTATAFYRYAFCFHAGIINKNKFETNFFSKTHVFRYSMTQQQSPHFCQSHTILFTRNILNNNL